MDWTGKVVVITGAGSGVGAAAAKLFAGNGAAVALLDFNGEAAEANAKALRAAGHKAVSARVDVVREDEVAAASERVMSEFGRVDMLANNAGITRRHDGMEGWTLEEIQRVIDTNLTGLFVMTHAFAPLMAKGGGGVIVNTSSVGAIIPVAFSPVYAATKAGVLGMTRSLAPVLQKQNIRVNAVLPTLIRTAFLAGSPVLTRGNVPMLQPEDVARAIQYAAGKPDLNSAFIIVENGPDGAARLARLSDPPEQTPLTDAF